MAPEYSPDPKRKYSITVVGVGIGGLCTAIGLLHQGVPIEIYEAAPAFAEIGAGFSLGPNAASGSAFAKDKLAQSMALRFLICHARPDQGRICMLGDAAHASTPHNGAGAGQAIEDALCMSRVMRLVYDEADLPKAFATFDKVWRLRSQKQVKLARDSGWLYDLELPGYMDDWNKIAETMKWKQEWIWNIDLEADVKEAERIFYDETSKL